MDKYATSFFFVLAVLMAYGTAHPAISNKSLRNRLTPSMTLVFQSLHSAAAAAHASEKKRVETVDMFSRPQQLNIGMKDDQSALPVALNAAPNDWLLANQGGVFGDAESGRLPLVVLIPIAHV